MRQNLEYNFLDENIISNPYSSYAEFRSIQPVFWNAAYGCWMVFSYQENLSLLRDPRLLSSRARSLVAHLPETDLRSNLEKIMNEWMIFKDGAEHARVRKLAALAMTPKNIEQFTPRIQNIVHETIRNAAQSF